MQGIRAALERLNGAINYLDGSLEGIEETLKGAQRDMFQGAPAEASNQNDQEAKAAMTTQIDKAIEKVEKLLGQA